MLVISQTLRLRVLPASQVKPSWGLRGSTRSCTNCNMTFLSWRRSLFLWAHCRGCTRYVPLHFTLPTVAGLSHRESLYHTTHIMQQSHAKGMGFLSPTESAGQTTDVTLCYVHQTTLRVLAQIGHMLTFKLSSTPKTSFKPATTRYLIRVYI